MQNIIPASRPQITKPEVLALIETYFPGTTLPDFFTLGIRGYYEDTMGEKGKNDRNMYDDAIFIIGKEEFIAFNGNTDPQAFRLGIATLCHGIWPVYKFDMHKGQYLALCQRGGNVTVTRDGKKEKFTGMFGINQHRGGTLRPNSEGCQTIPPTQWDEFITTAQNLAKKYFGKGYRDKSDYTYILIDKAAKVPAPKAAKPE